MPGWLTWVGQQFVQDIIQAVCLATVAALFFRWQQMRSWLQRIRRNAPMIAFCDRPIDDHGQVRLEGDPNNQGNPYPTYFYVGKEKLPERQHGHQKSSDDIWALQEVRQGYERCGFTPPPGVRTRLDFLLAASSTLAHSRGFGITNNRIIYTDSDEKIRSMSRGSFTSSATPFRGPRSFADESVS